jgi:hypothetical protein
MKHRISMAAAGAAALLALAAAPQEDGSARKARADAWTFLLGKYDADKDGILTRAEYTRDDAHWRNLDVDGDGKVDREEFEGREWRIVRKPHPVPKKGAVAPDFELEALPPRAKPKGDEKPAEGEKPAKKPKGGDAEDKPAKKVEPERVKLSAFRGARPVALIFGSYT